VRVRTPLWVLVRERSSQPRKCTRAAVGAVAAVGVGVGVFGCGGVTPEGAKRRTAIVFVAVVVVADTSARVNPGTVLGARAPVAVLLLLPCLLDRL
jgi:hypothetical protein